MLLLDMAYRLLREFRQAFTRLDTPPLSNRRHPGSDIAQTSPMATYPDKTLSLDPALHWNPMLWTEIPCYGPVLPLLYRLLVWWL